MERHLVVSKLILVTPMLLQLADDVALRLDESEVDSRLCSHIGLPSKYILHEACRNSVYISFIPTGWFAVENYTQQIAPNIALNEQKIH